MRDQIWSDRLLLRFKMKKDMKVYRAFLKDVVKREDDNDDDGTADSEEIDMKDAIPILHQFCTNELSIKQLRGIFQLPRSELTEILKDKYKICSAYAVVYCSVLEQVANFKVTGYGVDARCGSGGDKTEEVFENELMYKKIGPGFCLNIATSGNDEGKVNDEVLQKFLERMVSLAGPTLLARAPKISHDKDEGSGDEVRSDRRVVRLIARYWADRLMQKYNEAQKKKEEQQTIENPEVDA